MKERLFILSQYLLPHHLLSRLAGCIAECRVRWFKNAFTQWFAKRYQVDMSQALVEDLTAYEHFNAFFTRALKDGARPLDETPGAILSPADGAVSQLGPIEHGRVFQAKGHSFSVLELLGGDAANAAPFMGGDFATIYLSPKDYHRVHMPLAGTLREMVYIPGRIFSVNQTTAENVPELFARNERVACIFDTERGADGRGAGRCDDCRFDRNRVGRSGHATEARAENLPLRRSRTRTDSSGKRRGTWAFQAWFDGDRAVWPGSSEVGRRAGGRFARADGPRSGTAKSVTLFAEAAEAASANRGICCYGFAHEPDQLFSQAARSDSHANAPVVLRRQPARPQALDRQLAQGQHRRNRPPAVSRPRRTEPVAHSQRQSPATPGTAAARGVFRLPASGTALSASGDHARRTFAQSQQPVPGAARPVGHRL